MAGWLQKLRMNASVTRSSPFNWQTFNVEYQQTVCTFQYVRNPLSSLLDLAFRRHVVKRPLDLLVPRHLSSVGHVVGSAEDLGLGGDMKFCSDTRTSCPRVSVGEQLEMNSQRKRRGRAGH
jgi:hypothetical protein